MLGPVIYVLFGRDRKAFSRAKDTDPAGAALRSCAVTARILEDQDRCIDELDNSRPEAAQLLGLVRRSGHSTMTIRNRVEILQDAREKYPRLLADLEAAQHSIHLQYYLWGTDAFTEELKAILVAKARAGVDGARAL